ncbi:MAG: hypothetical protein NTW98_00445, partial [Candidatus Nomurabacteria bacterium]|nr:hypothetical protein [Candidatus Nomurabacteria bacterium]
MLWFLTKAVPPGHEERSDIVDLNVENKGWVDTTITVQTTQPYSGGHPNGEGVELKVIVVPAQG